MKTQKLTISAIMAISILLVGSTQAYEYWVAPPPAGDNANPGTQSQPFATIQHGINVAVMFGDIVTVKPGTYSETLSISNSTVTLRSTYSGLGDWDTVDQTIINGPGPGGTLITRSNSDGAIEGFTIQNGWSTWSSGAGLQLEDCNAAIRHCVIKNNQAVGVNGGGISCSNGFYTIEYCKILDNTTTGYGGGMYNSSCGLTIQNCIFSGNQALRGSVMENHFCSWGVGVTVDHCTIYGNPSGNDIAFYNSDTSYLFINNSILWDGSSIDNNIYNSNAGVSYSCVQDIPSYPIFPYTMCFSEDPMLNSDYHLNIGSPCINTGGSSIGMPPDYDIDGDSRLQNNRVDIGSDESQYNHMWYVDVDNISGIENGLTWEHAFTTIQEAVDAALDGDSVKVAEGTYVSNLLIDSKNITLSGAEAQDGLFGVEKFIMTAGGSGRSLCINNCNANVKGFTITGGSQTFAAGVWIMGTANPIIDRCIITGNTVTAGDGGGVYSASNYTLVNCGIWGNSATGNGGGVFGSGNGTLTNCTVYGNSAGISGGGVYDVDTCNNCILWDNTAVSQGNDYYSIVNKDHCHIEQDLATNPQFVNAPTDLRLKRESPCIDAGDDSSISGYDLDLAGNPRIVFTHVDIGAYEHCRSVLYVDISVISASYDGSSWKRPYKYFQDALNEARAYSGEINEIWVANGIYYPDIDVATESTGGSEIREDSFHLIDGVKLYGGFQGICAAFPTGEDSLKQRDADASVNPSILSGDIDLSGSYDSFNVVTANSVTVHAKMDRFTITGGNSNGTLANSNGGGMLCNAASPTITDCLFTGNVAEQRGGAMYNNFSSPVILRCTFTYNSAMYGGAIFNYYRGNPILTDCDFDNNDAEHGGAIMNHTHSQPKLTRCVFQDNTAATASFSGKGGAIANLSGSDPNLINCVLTENVADKKGGALYSRYKSPVDIVNCTIAFNEVLSGVEGAGLYVSADDSRAGIRNSIFWDNSASEQISLATQINNLDMDHTFHNCINGISQTNSNINPDPGITPIFLDPTDRQINRTHLDGLCLVSGSPCEDTGNNDAVPSGLFFDIAYYLRKQNGTVDRGAYEVGSLMPDEGIVVITFIDESDDGYSGSSKENEDRYKDHLASFQSTYAGVSLPIAAKCLVPINAVDPEDHQGAIDAVLPAGYQPPQPPTEILIENFPRPPADIQPFIDEFEEIVVSSLITPVYVLMSVDISGSLTREKIDNDANGYAYTEFISWLHKTYPGVVVVDETFTGEVWVKAMDDMLMELP